MMHKLTPGGSTWPKSKKEDLRERLMVSLNVRDREQNLGKATWMEFMEQITKEEEAAYVDCSQYLQRDSLNFYAFLNMCGVQLSKTWGKIYPNGIEQFSEFTAVVVCITTSKSRETDADTGPQCPWYYG